MTMAASPTPSSAKKGPNKGLLIVLGVVVVAALAYFAIQMLGDGSEPEQSADQTPTTTLAPDASPSPSPSPSPGSTTPEGGSTPPTTTTVPSANANDASPNIPPQLQQSARNPFKPLVDSGN